MAPDRRVTLFLLAAGMLVAVAATLSLVPTSANDRAQRAHRARAETAAVVLRSEPATELPVGVRVRRQSSGKQGGPEREDLPVDARPGVRAEPVTRRVEERARAFVAALLQREAGKSREARRSLLASSTRPLARFVLSARPRVPAATAGPGDSRIGEVDTVRLDPGRALAQVTVTRDGTGASVVLVELVRVEGRWRAAALR